MRKVIRYIVWFFLPVALTVILIPIGKKYRYQSLENDCMNQASWIYDRIFNNETPVDIAFLGSSHTINGINDMLIDSMLSAEETNVVNLGYCRLGRNLDYVLLKDLLKQKRPRIILTEVRGDEDWFSHPMFPYLADGLDVFLPTVFYNRDLFADYYIAFTFKLQLFQDILFNRIRPAAINKNLYGFATPGDTASNEVLIKAMERNAQPRKKTGKVMRIINMSFSRSYLKKVADLCRKNQIDLYFIYLPHYAPLYKQPLEYETYQKYGKIIYLSDSILNDPNNWYDDEHLNQTGASKLGGWLARELNQITNPLSISENIEEVK